MRCAALVLAFGVLLSSCAARIESTFDPSEATYALKEGSGRVEGSVFLRSYHGRIVKGAGEIVSLLPATAYTDELIGKVYGSRKFTPALLVPKILNPDPEFGKYIRRTKADIRGEFAFDRVPPGKYYVLSMVTWPDKEGYVPNGGLVYDEAKVTGGETVTVILSGH